MFRIFVHSFNNNNIYAILGGLRHRFQSGQNCSFIRSQNAFKFENSPCKPCSTGEPLGFHNVWHKMPNIEQSTSVALSPVKNGLSPRWMEMALRSLMPISYTSASVCRPIPWPMADLSKRLEMSGIIQRTTYGSPLWMSGSVRPFVYTQRLKRPTLHIY